MNISTHLAPCSARKASIACAQLVDAGHHGFLESRLLGREVAIQCAGRDRCFLGQAVDADPSIASLAKAAADRRKDSRFGFLLCVRVRISTRWPLLYHDRNFIA